MTDAPHFHEHPHPPFHHGWGGFAEELFHYTSRYYFATEAFLRNLTEDRGFSMGGYKAARLSDSQRELMGAILSCQPNRDTAQTVMDIVTRVQQQDPGIEHAWLERYRDRLEQPVKRPTLHLRPVADDQDSTGVPPLDPFLSLAERLQMAVAVRKRHVEVSLHTLAQHLDSGNTTLRSNLQNAVIQLHNAGYQLRNHPHLTHSEAHAIADEDAV